MPPDEGLVKRRFWDKMRRSLRHVPFAEDAVASYYCATDEDTPTYVRATLMGALAYFIVPTDAIPDVIFTLGFTDDATVLTAAMAAIGGNLKDQHRDLARRWLGKADPKGPPPPDRDSAPPANAA